MASEPAHSCPFQFFAKEDKGLILIDMQGPLNSRYSPMLRDAIAKAFQAQNQIVIVNVDQVEYMDSSGLATLVEGVQLAENSGGKFVLAGQIHEKVQHLFEITRLDGLFENYLNMEEAKRKFQRT